MSQSGVILQLPASKLERPDRRWPPGPAVAARVGHRRYRSVSVGESGSVTARSCTPPSRNDLPSMPG